MTDSNPQPTRSLDLCELAIRRRNATFQQEVALHIMNSHIADLKPHTHQGPFEELANAHRETKKAIDNQDIKISTSRT